MPQRNLSIHFFRLRFDGHSHLINEPIPDLNQVFGEIQKLSLDILQNGIPDTSKSSRFMLEDNEDDTYLVCDVQNSAPPYFIRFARIRQTEIEVLYKDKFGIVNLPPDFFPIQTTYAVCFANGIVGVCFNRSGPRFNQITSYICEKLQNKVQGVQDCSCGELLRSDTFERLRNMQGLTDIDLRFYPSFADEIKIQGINIRPVNSPSTIELHIHGIGHSPLDQNILDGIKNLLLAVGVPQSLVKAKLTGPISVPGRNRKKGSTPLLQDTVEQGVIDIMKKNFIIKTKVKLDPSNGITIDKLIPGAIVDTYHDLEGELQKAVEAMR